MYDATHYWFPNGDDEGQTQICGPYDAILRGPELTIDWSTSDLEEAEYNLARLRKSKGDAWEGGLFDARTGLQIGTVSACMFKASKSLLLFGLWKGPEGDERWCVELEPM